MLKPPQRSLIVITLCVVLAGCLGEDAQKGTAGKAAANPTPSKSFTPADVAKLKWI